MNRSAVAKKIVRFAVANNFGRNLQIALNIVARTGALVLAMKMSFAEKQMATHKKGKSEK